MNIEEEKFDDLEDVLTPPTPTPQENGDTDTKDLEIIYSVLKENNLVDELDEMTEDKLNEAIGGVQNKLIDRIKGGLPDKGKQLIELILSKQYNLTDEDIEEYISLIKPTASVQLETYDDKFNFLKAKVKEQNPNYSDKVIDKMMEGIVEDDLLESEIEKIINDNSKVVNKINENKTLSDSKKQEIETFATNVVTEIKNTQWNDEFKQNVFSELESQTFFKKLDKINNSPKSLVQLASILRFYDEEKDIIDLDKYIKITLSKELDNRKNSIVRNIAENIRSKSTNGELNKNDFKNEMDSIIEIYK